MDAKRQVPRINMAVEELTYKFNSEKILLVKRSLQINKKLWTKKLLKEGSFTP